MQITAVQNPSYFLDGVKIHCQVQLDGDTSKWVDYLAVPDDVEPHGLQLFNDLTAGKYGVISAYVVPPLTEEAIAAQAAAQKQSALDSIIVTTSTGKQFNGDESARNNMLCALTVAGFTGQTSTNWKLAGNTTATITLDELREALALSITQVGKIIGAIA